MAKVLVRYKRIEYYEEVVDYDTGINNWEELLEQDWCDGTLDLPEDSTPVDEDVEILGIEQIDE